MQPKKKSELTEYDKLRAIWYKKLEEEGFEDIESDENNLKIWSATRFASKKSQDVSQGKEAYYYMATHFLNDYPFESKVEKLIWEYHADGHSVKDIVIILKKRRFKKLLQWSAVNRTAVNTIINRLEKTMKNMYLSGYQATYE
jgi:hypothetical protein